MSNSHNEKIVCPICGKESEITIWDSINIDSNPMIKKQVFDGSIFNFVCPECGYKINLSYDCLYNDVESHMMIYHVTDDKDIHQLIKMLNQSFMSFICLNAREFSHKSHCRIVINDPNAWREKIMIFNEGYDDRVIELIKLFIINKIDDEKLLKKIEYCYFEANKHDDRENSESLIFMDINYKYLTEVKFDQCLYNKIAEMLIKPYDSLVENNFKSEYIIDEDWALKVIETVKNMEQKS